MSSLELSWFLAGSATTATRTAAALASRPCYQPVVVVALTPAVSADLNPTKLLMADSIERQIFSGFSTERAL